MIRTIDIRDQSCAIRILALQAAAYLVEAERLGFREIPPLHDSVPSLQASGETFLGYYDETNTLAGAVSYKLQEKILKICRMMVQPDHFRKGIASKLLSQVLKHPGSHTEFNVVTGTANIPAINLYIKHGFQPLQIHDMLPGITLTELVRNHPEA